MILGGSVLVGALKAPPLFSSLFVVLCFSCSHVIIRLSVSFFLYPPINVIFRCISLLALVDQGLLPDLRSVSSEHLCWALRI